MIKKFSTVALAALLAIPAMASGSTTSDLEQKMAEMAAQMDAMQKELTAIKSREQASTVTTVPATPASTSVASTAASWADKITLSGQIRFRDYYHANFLDFDDDNDADRWDTYRLKGSLKATIKASDNITGVLQLTDQTYGNGVTNAGTWEEDNKSNKMFLDNAYIEARNMFGLPVDLKMGRMNLIYGSGFVILDGNSQFASTSIYFDGVRLRYNINDNIFVDGLYMKDEENNRDNNSNDDITLSGAYFTAKAFPVIGKTETYILNRNDDSIKKDIWMFGARVSRKLDMGIDYSVEAGIQTGDAGNGGDGVTVQDQDAWATKIDIGYTFKQVDMKPRIFTNYTFMSGDDPNSSDNEGWDVFYGGWPQFGDGLAWKFINVGGGNSLSNVYDYNKLSSTGGEAVFSNMQIITLGASANLVKDLNLKVSYSNLQFDETYAGIDDDFGDYYQMKLKYAYTKFLSFSLYGALLQPGDAFETFTPQDDQIEVFVETDFHF